MPRRFLRQAPGLAQRVLAGRRVGDARGRQVGHRGAVAQRPDRSRRRRRAASRRPRRGRGRRPAARARSPAGWPPHRPSTPRSRSSIRRPSESPTPSASTEASRVCVTISTAAPGERALGEAGEAVGRLAEDALRAVDQHPARLDVGQARVVAQRLLGHLRDLGDRLDAGEAGARDDEGQPPRGGVGRGVGELDLAQDVVAQADRVAEVLEAERVLAQARARAGCGSPSRARSRAARRRSRCGPPRTAPRPRDARDRARRRSRARGRRGGTWCAAAPRRGGARCCPPPPRAAAACRA